MLRKKIVFPKKRCLFCNVKLKLRIRRDIQRKKFCSRACQFRYNYTHNPNYCNKNKPHSSETKKLISKRLGDQSGAKNRNWKGGTRIYKGYKLIFSEGKCIAEHREKVEKILGRKLKQNEVIHHIDGDKLNNCNRNLLVCTASYHAWLHRRMGFLYQQVMFGQKNAD